LGIIKGRICGVAKRLLKRHDGNKIRAVELMGKKYEKVESFKYLGSMMTSINDIETEIKREIAVSNKCYYALGPILKRRSISQSVKIHLYKTIIRPTVTYGAETWTLSSKIEKNVNDVGEKDTEENTGCPRRNGQNFRRVFLMLNYTDITQNTHIQS